MFGKVGFIGGDDYIDVVFGDLFFGDCLNGGYVIGDDFVVGECMVGFFKLVS